MGFYQSTVHMVIMPLYQKKHSSYSASFRLKLANSAYALLDSWYVKTSPSINLSTSLSTSLSMEHSPCEPELLVQLSDMSMFFIIDAVELSALQILATAFRYIWARVLDSMFNKVVAMFDIQVQGNICT